MNIPAASTSFASSTAGLLTSKPSADVSTTSFAEKLASALESLLNQSGTGARIEIGIEPANGSNSGTRQFVITVTDGSSSSQPAPAASPTQPVTLMSIPIAPTQASTSAAETAPVNPGPPRLTLANGKIVTNEYEAYWATQPAEVQALMYASSEAKRTELAHELADQGFLIDVPIMVWGWDPLSTMVVRRNQGYTWVPSANQDPVKVAPGVNFPGLPGYDPKNPPAGSIAVTTDFANGFEHTCPWPIDPADWAAA
jgi:hypothetical protein